MCILESECGIKPTGEGEEKVEAVQRGWVCRIEMQATEVHELLQRHRYVEALRTAQAMAVDAPENRDALYAIARSHRYLGQIAEAFEALDELERYHATFSRIHEERGHCHVIRKDAARAIHEFVQAVNMNPALGVSWGMLERLFRITGQMDEAANAAAHVATLRGLPREVVRATGLFADGEITAAESLIRAFLQLHERNVEAMALLAKIGMRRGVFDDAEFLLAAALDIAPDYRAARLDYARTLLERHKYLQAREQLEKLLQVDSRNFQYRTLYAAARVGLGEYEEAASLYRELNSEAPTADLQLSLGHALKTLGRQAEAIEAYRGAAALRPGFGEAYWSLANLKTYRFTDAEIASMQSWESAPAVSTVDRYHFLFALGKALEDRHEYEESFRLYECGNALKRAESRYRPEIVEANSRSQIEVCTRDFFITRAGWGVPDADPIFIVGLPRAGSTLLEQILASHSQVEGTQELADIPRIVIELQGKDPDLNNPRYPKVLASLSAQDFRRLGERYMADTRVYRRTGRSHFIDKMPNNFRHVGLIHLILPNARIIDARREPMACCISNLKQLFARGQEFSYSVGDIARYYRTYIDVMEHWYRVLPGKILRVFYEDVVSDLHGSVRKVLEFCGLEYESRCVEFHKTQRDVRTASSEQVRQPIFRESVQQWKNFEPWLSSLREALGDALVRYRG